MSTYERIIEEALSGAASDGAITDAERLKAREDHAMLLSCRLELAQLVSSVRIHEEVNKHATAYLVGAEVLLAKLDERLGAAAPPLRQQQDDPTGVLPTTLGAVSFTLTHDSHVYLYTEPRLGQLVTVRGVQYHVNLHLYRNPGNTRWSPIKEGSTAEQAAADLYVRKADPNISYNASFGSASARHAILTTLLDAWQAHATANQPLLIKAELVRLNNAIGAAEEQQTKLYDELASCARDKEIFLGEEARIKKERA